MRLLLIFGFSIICAYAQVEIAVPEDSTVSVEITQGTVVGSISEDLSYYEFYGIPYADSTSGSHRFKAPLPAPSFQDTFIADRKDIKCVRPLGVGYEGVEDCLVANVFTPTVDSTSRLPVMVWIKGREFDRVYEHELSFKNFLDQEVIVVSLNFRESILGFLCLGTEEAPGNAGLKDIIAGLRWVKENIESFGGDPDSITLFGHGSGAAAVDLVTLSPMSQGLVDRVITQSGTAIAPWAVSRDNLEYAIQVAEALGHTINDINTLSEVYTRTSVAALMAVINELELTDNSLAFAPCLEKETLTTSLPFLTKSPFETLNDADFVQVPFMTGFVDKEGTIRAEEAIEDDWLSKMEATFDSFLQPDLEFETEEQEAQVAQEIKNFYFGDQPVTIDNMNDYLNYHGDTMIKVSAIREAQMRAAVSEVPVYLYQFSYKGSLGEPFVGPVDVDGAAHSEELAYLFHETIETENNQLDLMVSDILIERWTNFAKNGVPSSDSSQVEWEPFTTENSNYLHIVNNDNEESSTLEVELQNPHAVTITFWNQIYQNYFKDAEGRWELTDRNDEDDEEVAESGEAGGEDGSEEGGVESGGEDGSEGGDGEGEEEIEAVDTDSEEDESDSAATAVKYTFFIISAFAVLNQFHSSQIIS